MYHAGAFAGGTADGRGARIRHSSRAGKWDGDAQAETQDIGVVAFTLSSIACGEPGLIFSTAPPYVPGCFTPELA